MESLLHVLNGGMRIFVGNICKPTPPQVNTGTRLLSDVRGDLSDVVKVCEAAKKQTNYLRSLTSNLAKGIIPRSWNRYTVPPGLTVMQWVADFTERIKQLQNISKQVAINGAKVLKVSVVTGCYSTSIHSPVLIAWWFGVGDFETRFHLCWHGS